MGTSKWILFCLAIVEILLLTGCRKGVPKEVEDLVFKSDKFNSPIVLSLPGDLSAKEESWYREALKTSWLPPLPPASGKLTSINPDLKDILSGLGFIRI